MVLDSGVNILFSIIIRNVQNYIRMYMKIYNMFVADNEGR